jgi:twitching motility two-component system response regulator PilH
MVSSSSCVREGARHRRRDGIQPRCDSVANETILVVDDSPTDLRLMSMPLRIQGYRVITARDGEEALEKAVQEQPRLIVLDIVLPRKNGFQVCRELKTAPETCAIKVLLLTSKNQASDRYWGLKQGADDYMTKPFDDEELLASVARLL